MCALCLRDPGRCSLAQVFNGLPGCLGNVDKAPQDKSSPPDLFYQQMISPSLSWHPRQIQKQMNTREWTLLELIHHQEGSQWSFGHHLDNHKHICSDTETRESEWRLCMRDHLRNLRSGNVAFVWSHRARPLGENRQSVHDTISSVQVFVTSWQNPQGGRGFNLLELHCVLVQIDHSTDLLEWRHRSQGRDSRTVHHSVFHYTVDASHARRHLHFAQHLGFANNAHSLDNAMDDTGLQSKLVKESLFSLSKWAEIDDSALCSSVVGE